MAYSNGRFDETGVFGCAADRLALADRVWEAWMARAVDDRIACICWLFIKYEWKEETVKHG